MKIEDRKSPRGFTLIELLVVIAIISLLVSILLPSLNRAKELAKRAVCASNIHQASLAYTFYASEYNECVPVGYQNEKQRNYVILHRSCGLLMIGYLHKAKLMEQPEVFYCPSNTLPHTSFNTESNPWPPEDLPAWLTLCRAGYSVRPEVQWPCGTGPDPFPTLTNLSGQALIADIPYLGDIAARHEVGVNVGYIDGSAGFVDMGLFEDILELFGPWGAGNDPLVDELWDIYDEQH